MGAGSFSYGQRIKTLRQGAGLTQGQLGQRLGISTQVMSMYENGREPPYEILCNIATIFGVSTDYLLGLSPYPNTEQCTAIDEKFLALPLKMRLKFSETQIALLRAADTFRWASEQVTVIGDLFDYLSDDLQKCIDAYIQLVDGNTPETNWRTSPDSFVDQFLSDRAKMSRNISGVINCIYQRGNIGADAILKNQEGSPHGIDQETDH